VGADVGASIGGAAYVRPQRLPSPRYSLACAWRPLAAQGTAEWTTRVDNPGGHVREVRCDAALLQLVRRVRPAAAPATMTDDPFTADEREAQRRAGFTASGSAIRAFMTQQHREFFPLLTYLFVAVRDAGGWPLATVLTGEVGFVSSPTPTALRVKTHPPEADPASSGMGVGRQIGMLGLDLATRRRNRANGSIREIGGSAFAAEIDESFGNCARHIQRRSVHAVDRCAGPTTAFAQLPVQHRDLIGRADTFFVASGARADLPKGGLDISHRGGMPGFVGISGNRLSVPDFRGNRYCNTLGNMLGEPRVGLLFIDFATGGLLQLQGRAAIDWSVSAAAAEGAERVWNVVIERGWWRAEALPLTWALL
jgi:predicted pyridoxine 5'-phosphate oxidase superfamily flavin-nucleotide-binding protein